MTRLLKTPIIGPRAAIVDSSWIEIGAWLVAKGMRRMPPYFSAPAVAAPVAASISATAIVVMVRRIAFPLNRFIRPLLEEGLFVEPGVFAAIGAEDAVGTQRDVLDVRLPAGRDAAIGDDRPSKMLGVFVLALPQHLLAAIFVCLFGLLLKQVVDVLIAIAVPVKACAAAVKQLERLGSTGLQVERDRKFLAHDLRKIA